MHRTNAKQIPENSSKTPQNENPVLAQVKSECRSRSSSFTKKNVKAVVDKVLTKVFPTEDKNEGRRSRGHSFGMQPYIGNVNVDIKPDKKTQDK